MLGGHIPSPEGAGVPKKREVWQAYLTKRRQNTQTLSCSCGKNSIFPSDKQFFSGNYFSNCHVPHAKAASLGRRNAAVQEKNEMTECLIQYYKR